MTDEEAAICNAIDIHLPSLSRLKCWNHVINAAKVGVNFCAFANMLVKYAFVDRSTKMCVGVCKHSLVFHFN